MTCNYLDNPSFTNGKYETTDSNQN